MNLFAGPCNYEFGHELFSFQGYIRHLSKSHDKTVVCSKKSMRFLYEDFCDHFLSIEQHTNREKYSSYKTIDCSEAISGKQDFIKYGKPVGEKYDIVFHARRKEGLCRNLSDKTYDNIHKLLVNKYTISFVGSKDGAYCPNGAIDLRGIELKDLANIFSSSRLVVGNSSGPIHFASLCGAKHLTWGGYRPRTFARYAHLWNPFKAKCYLFEDLEDINYLKSRATLFKLPKDIFNSSHFSIVNAKEHRLPSVELLYNTIENIFNE